MRIAILGSTSEIAKDLILSFALNTNHELLLFCRDSIFLSDWLREQGFGEKFHVCEYGKLDSFENIDAIINFVGVGDPSKALDMGASIVEVTELFDYKALKYLKKNTRCKYLYISSGAVYGGNFNAPPNKNTFAEIPINQIESRYYYAIAKVQAELRHRSSWDANIIDIRIFSYFSRTQNFNSSFFMSEVIRALQKNEVLITGPENIYRDYLGSREFFKLILCALAYKQCNIAVDAYTLGPVGKFELLERLHKDYGLKYSIINSRNSLNIEPQKTHYYSNYYAAKSMGYHPQLNSLESIINEVKMII